MKRPKKPSNRIRLKSARPPRRTGVFICSATTYRHAQRGARTLGMNLLLTIVLVVLLLGLLPTWPYSGSWGYFPSGTVGLILLVVLLMAIFRRGV